MKCPKCETPNREVDDSRLSNLFGGSKRRRRFCRKCKEKFTTYELHLETLQKLVNHERSTKRYTDAAREFVEKLERLIEEGGDESDLPPVDFDHPRYRV